jgi:hypothetical protein
MKPAAPLLAACCVSFPLLLGCSRNDTSTPAAPADAQSGPVSQPADDEGLQSLVGDLQSVDPDTRSFTVVSGDELAVFEFTDDTQVVGAPNVRGLTGDTGDRVTVRYRTHPVTSTKTAVRIDMN